MPDANNRLAPLSALADRYTIEREIGRGGMATVYRARDLKHDRAVAIKVLETDNATASSERFTREIALTARLSHPNILPLLDSGRVGEVNFYVAPLVDGGSLRDRMRAGGELPIAEAVRIAIDVADALDHAHRSGVVHRDIKPENILLQHGRPVVSDFGIAGLRDPGADKLTATGVALGTPMYMAPEQATAERATDGRADQYALGCVLFEMLTGSPPFPGSNTLSVMARHASDERPSIRSVRPAVPLSLERAVHRAMARLPADRFESTAAFRDALTAALDERPRGNRTWILAASIAAAAALAAVGLYFTSTISDLPNIGQAGDPAPEGARIAVLPMSNIGPDASDDHFAAGMTDELISTLAGIDGIRVISRTSVMRYASSTMSVGDIARELGVTSIIESTCRKENHRLRIGVRLIDATTQEQRWSTQYDKPVTDLFDIQRDIAQHVADALRVQFGRSSAGVRGSTLASSSEAALELYIRGRGVSRVNPSEVQIDSSIAFLSRAIAIDSNFAAAYAELAEAYVAKLFRFAPGPRYRTLADDAIAHALRLDSALAEAYVARADLAYTPEGGWNFITAIRDYRHALSLKPSHSVGRAKYGVMLMHLGMFEPALKELRASMALDPFQTFAALRVGRILWQSQRFDSALAAFEQGPSVTAEHGMLFGYLGRPADGLAFLATKEPTAAAGNRGDLAAARAALYAWLGRRADAEREIRIASTFQRGTAHFHHAAFAIGVAHILLDKPAEAVQWLTEMANGGMPAYELLLNDPVVRRLRGNAEYEKLLAAERARYQALLQVIASAP